MDECKNDNINEIQCEKGTLTNEEIISLISVYLNEWKHRDDVLWRQVFKFYYVTLITMVFPHITGYLNANFIIEDARLFYYIGLVMSMIFYYVAIAIAMRARASYKAYEKVVNLLEDNKHTYTRVSVATLRFGAFFNFPLAIGIITIMFISLVCIAIILLLN